MAPEVLDERPVRAALVATAALLAARWLARARRRVVIEEFAGYTQDDGESAKGLATLLVADLARLRELYGRVNDQLSTPASVGVRRHGGTGPGTEPGSYLSVRADDVTGTLNDAIASQSKVEIGGFSIPIGLVLGLLGRLARGPRIMGSLHVNDATGGPVITAQIVGRGESRQWRIDGSSVAAGDGFLEPMVTELASRMFTDLNLHGSVRWRAVRSFTRYLELYWESHRTPRDRARNLKLAEGELLQAIAEDETFDLAFYNLGVIYSQLAETEHAAAQASDYVKKADAPDEAYRRRLDAALAAFERAVAMNRDRAEAVYALAVHEYARAVALGDERARSELHECVVCRCDRVLELDPGNAQAHDLKGMALARMGQPAAARRSHARAVALSWRRLRRVERAERVCPPALESAVPAARANAAAALHNLARLQPELPGGRRMRLARAGRLYRRALRLAPIETRAAMLFERGRMLDGLSRPAAARECYDAALQIEPENPVYWAHLAAAYAAEAETASAEERAALRETAGRRAHAALHALAPVYRRTLELHPPTAKVELRDNTLAALLHAYGLLDAAAERRRVKEIGFLRHALQAATAARDVRALRALKDRCGEGREWEREQVQIALARTLGRRGAWATAAREYEELIGMLATHRPQGIVEHSLYAKHARALRRAGRYDEALAVAARGELQNPLSASARRELGKAHFALLQFEEALEAWQHTLWLTPNDPHLHWKVGFCHWSVAQDRRGTDSRRTSLEAAADCFEPAATLFGVGASEGWAWSQLWAGRVHAELGDHDAAVRHLRSASGCRATEAAAALLLGEVYRELGEQALSRLQLDRADTLAGMTPGPGNVDADWGETLTWRELAVRARVGLGRWELEADGDCERALWRAEDASAIADQIEDERARARCVALAADLEAGAHARATAAEAAAPVRR